MLATDSVRKLSPWGSDILMCLPIFAILFHFLLQFHKYASNAYSILLFDFFKKKLNLSVLYFLLRTRLVLSPYTIVEKKREEKWKEGLIELVKKRQ